MNFIGGFSALVHKGATRGDDALIASIPEALALTERVCASVNVGTTRAGINMDAVARMGEMIRETAGSRRSATASAARSSSCSATRSRTTRSWPARFTASASPSACSTSA